MFVFFFHKQNISFYCRDKNQWKKKNKPNSFGDSNNFIVLPDLYFVFTCAVSHLAGSETGPEVLVTVLELAPPFLTHTGTLTGPVVCRQRSVLQWWSNRVCEVTALTQVSCPLATLHPKTWAGGRRGWTHSQMSGSVLGYPGLSWSTHMSQDYTLCGESWDF